MQADAGRVPSAAASSVASAAAPSVDPASAGEPPPQPTTNAPQVITIAHALIFASRFRGQSPETVPLGASLGVAD